MNVTHDELSELMQGLLSGISDMFDARDKALDQKLERMENQILMRLENGIEKKADLLGEKVDGLEKHLASVEADTKEIKARLDLHDAEIYTLKRIK